MQEFRYGKFLKLFIFIFCPGLIALFVWALFQYDEKNPLVYFLAIFPASVGMIIIAVLGIADVIMARFVIAHDRVLLRSPFGYRMLMLEEIRGYRQDQNYIRIVPISKSQKEIKISKYLNDKHLIVEWLIGAYPNLDILEGDEEEREVLESDEIGFTEERREERLKRARKVATILNGGAWMLLVWLFVFPKYRDAGIVVCCAYPVIALFVTLSYRGLFSPDEYENSKMPSIATSFILPGVALALRAIMDFTLLEYPKWFWFAVVLVSIVFAIMYLAASFKSTSKPSRFYVSGLVMAFLNIFYSYGVLVESNCMLDKSEPSTYETTIAGKRVSKGKTTTYYFDLEPWGTLTEEHEVKVTKDEYESAKEGDPIVVIQHAGYIKIPWIEVKIPEL
jgi:hypothetical protein